MRERKAEGQTEETKTTVWPFQSNSCMACWNARLTADDGINAPRAHGIVVSQPVHLVEKNGKTTIVCYVARCMNCGHVASYGAVNMIFKMPLSRPDTNISRWPEILRNDIDPMDFEEAICNAKKGPIYLDARNGLQEPPIPAEWKARLEKFIAQRRTETRERAAFYEPIYAGRM